MEIKVTYSLRYSAAKYEATFKSYNELYNTVTLIAPSGGIKIIAYYNIYLYEYKIDRLHVVLDPINYTRADLWKWFDYKLNGRAQNRVPVVVQKPKPKIMFTIRS